MPAFRAHRTDLIARYLHTCRELAGFCSQNGWIDDETLRYQVLGREGNTLIVIVEFEEILMEGAGCVAGRVSCYGRMRLYLDEDGDVERGELL